MIALFFLGIFSLVMKHQNHWRIHNPNLEYLQDTVYLTIIPQAREWNNFFLKNHQQILLDFADFAWLEQPEGNLMDAISQVWYNGSYTIAAKPIKTLELHYTMIQFLINIFIIQLHFIEYK